MRAHWPSLLLIVAFAMPIASAASIPEELDGAHAPLVASTRTAVDSASETAADGAASAALHAAAVPPYARAAIAAERDAWASVRSIECAAAEAVGVACIAMLSSLTPLHDGFWDGGAEPVLGFSEELDTVLFDLATDLRSVDTRVYDHPCAASVNHCAP
jgi:hypothetical protein